MTRTPSHLHDLPLFAGLSRRQLAAAEALMTPVELADGDLLCQEDHIGREAFLLVEGEAAVSRGPDLLATLGPGDIVGELALLGDGVRSATVTATGPLRAYVMNAREFASLLGLADLGDLVRRAAATRTTPTPAAA